MAEALYSEINWAFTWKQGEFQWKVKLCVLFREFTWKQGTLRWKVKLRVLFREFIWKQGVLRWEFNRVLF